MLDKDCQIVQSFTMPEEERKSSSDEKSLKDYFSDLRFLSSAPLWESNPSDGIGEKSNWAVKSIYMEQHCPPPEEV